MRTLPALTLLLVPPAAADVLDVGGPTPDFAQIGAAVQAAADGDVVRVWPGGYAAFTVQDKSLSIVKAAAGAVMVGGTYRVTNLSLSKVVSVHGIDATGVDGHGLVVSDCQGAVRIREASFTGGFRQGGPAPGALVRNCRDVSLVDCHLTGGAASSGEYGSQGGSGLVVEESRLSAWACSFRGLPGTTDDDPGASGYHGGHGVVASGAGRLWAAGCTFTGGDGGDADYDPDPFSGEYGHGGAGGDGCRTLSGGEAWFLDATFEPGEGGSSPDPGKHGQDGKDKTGGTLLPGVARVLRASALVADTEAIQLRFEGAPGDRVFLFVGEGVAYRFLPPRGPLLVRSWQGKAFLPWRFVGTLDVNGKLLAEHSLPDLPPLGHDTRFLQAVFLGTETYLSSAAVSIILDAAW